MTQIDTLTARVSATTQAERDALHTLWAESELFKIVEVHFDIADPDSAQVILKRVLT